MCEQQSLGYLTKKRDFMLLCCLVRQSQSNFVIQNRFLVEELSKLILVGH